MKKIILSAMFATVSAPVFAGGNCDNTNLTAWSNFQDNGHVNVTAESAMAATSCGITIGVSHSGKSFVADTNPNNEQRYRVRMYVDPNSASIPTSGTDRRIKFHNAQCTSGAPACQNTGVVQFKLENTAGGYNIVGFVRDLNSSGNAQTGVGFKNKFDVPLSDAPNAIEYDLDMAAGTFKLWVDATSESDPLTVDLSGLDLSAWEGIHEARLGMVNTPVNIATSESVFVDEFESRRQTFIGQ